MKFRAFTFLFFFAFLALSAGQQPPLEPLTRGEVTNLVKAGMEAADLVKLIHEHGINFDLTDDYVQELRSAGAQDSVLQALGAARPTRLTQEQVLQLVAGHVPSGRAGMLVGQHGIDFQPDEEYLKTLRLAGGDDALIAALREAGKAVKAEFAVETSPGAEVYLDGVLQGKAGTEGELKMTAPPGDHALKVSLQGKKAFEQKVALTAGKATRMEARLEDAGPPLGQAKENSKDGLKYVRIPPGTFMMGCSPGDSECYPSENPPHRVTITKGFQIGQTPVTVGAYKRFAAAIKLHLPDAPVFNNGWTNDHMPMVNVTWDDAQAYCGWLGGRLPTEAEWEYAARAGSTEARYGPIDEIAWYSGDSGNHAHEVAQKRANGFGLYDMLGNVWEWVSDWYDASYYQSSPPQDPPGPASGLGRVLRGGSWMNSSRGVRASVRYRVNPATRTPERGFRCGGESF
jgi:formylglycine-generating enzyme required for sulfatase activity